MYFLSQTLPGLEENLALDEALLLEAEAGRAGESLRIWEWRQPAVVLGSGGRLVVDVHEQTCLENDVPILRRASGGGTVLLGKGCLLFSLVLAYQRAPALQEITSSYRFILEQLATVLGTLQANIERAGISDLMVDQRKFSGNSQQRKRGHLLHHGTLLYDFALDDIGRYLRQPERQPDYRQDRLHGDFVMNLSASAHELELRLRQAWCADGDVPALPLELVGRLVEEKYATREWQRRR